MEDVARKAYSFGYHFWGAVKKSASAFPPSSDLPRRLKTSVNPVVMWMIKPSCFSLFPIFWHIRKKGRENLKNLIWILTGFHVPASQSGNLFLSMI